MPKHDSRDNWNSHEIEGSNGVIAILETEPSLDPEYVEVLLEELRPRFKEIDEKIAGRRTKHQNQRLLAAALKAVFENPETPVSLFNAMSDEIPMRKTCSANHILRKRFSKCAPKRRTSKINRQKTIESSSLLPRGRAI